MTWMSYLTKTDAAEQVWTLMVNFPVLGCFPVYGLTVSRTRQNHSENPQWYGFIQKMFVNKWTSGCELTWSFLDTHIWHILRNKSKCSRTRQNAAEQAKIHKKKWSCNNATDLLLLKFLQWFLTLGLDSCFNKCAILTCRHSVKRKSWNKVVLCLVAPLWQDFALL